MKCVKGNATLELLLGAPILVLLGASVVHLSLLYSSHASALHAWEQLQRAVQAGSASTGNAAETLRELERNQSTLLENTLGIEIAEIRITATPGLADDVRVVSTANYRDANGGCTDGEVLGPLQAGRQGSSIFALEAGRSGESEPLRIGGSDARSAQPVTVRLLYVKARFLKRGIATMNLSDSESRPRTLCLETMLVPYSQGGV